MQGVQVWFPGWATKISPAMQPKSFKNKIKLDLKNFFFFFKEEAKITVFLFQWENVTWRKG